MISAAGYTGQAIICHWLGRFWYSGNCREFSNEAQVFQDLGFSPEIENILLFCSPFDIDQNASALPDLINSQVQLISEP